MRGKFVTIEGCEGVGKSTQTRFLKEYCLRSGIDAVFTREPGGTFISEQIRNVILNPENSAMDSMTELLLYSAARRQHTIEFILPHVNSGKIVFCDRYIDSTLAYQGFARNLDKEIISNLNLYAMGEAKIDLTLFLNVNPENGFIRKGGADSKDRLENEGMEFHKKVYKGFCELAKAYPDRIVSVDASGTKFQTHDKIIDILKQSDIF